MVAQFAIDKVEWQQTNDARFPWSARVEGSIWLVRINEFPEENYLYTLFVDGIETVGFNEWPGRSAQQNEESDDTSKQAMDLHEMAQYDAEIEWAKRAEAIKPSNRTKGMIWQIRDGHFLVEGNRYPIYLSGSGYGVPLPDGNEIRDAAEFFEFTESGRLVKKYGPPFTSTLEEFLYVTDIHVVIVDALYKFFWIERLSDRRLEHSRLFHGLNRIDDRDLPFELKYVPDLKTSAD